MIGLRGVLLGSAINILAVTMFIVPTTAAASCIQNQPVKPLEVVLTNGLKVVVVCDPVAPIATSVMTYMVGSADVPGDMRGIAHSQEHMMFRGTAALSADQLANIGALLGGRYNAVTREHFTRYYYTVPSDLLDVVLHTEALRLQDVSDASAAWVQEKAAIAQEISYASSSPVFLFTEKARKQVFHGTPNEGGVLGTEAALDTITPDLLKEFYRTWYVPNNATLVIVGKVDPDKVIVSVRRIFGGIRARPLPSRVLTHLEAIHPTPIVQETDLPFAVATLSFRMPGSNNPDYPAFRLLVDILNDPQSPLTKLTVQGHTLASTFMDIIQLPEADLGTAWVAYPAAQTPDSVLSLLRVVLARFASVPVPVSILDTVKRKNALTFELSKVSIEDYAMEWADALTIRGDRSPDELCHRIQRVTPADLLHVAQSYMAPNEEIVGILAPGDVTSMKSSTMPSVAEVLGVTNFSKTTLPTWASKDLMHLRVSPPPKAKAFTLHNGLKLIVIPESNTKSISIYGHVETEVGLSTPKGKEGVDALLTMMFNAGSSRSSRDIVQDNLSRINATATFGERFSLVVPPAALEVGLGILAETQLAPRLTLIDFQSAERQLTATTAAVLGSPYYKSELLLRKAMLPTADPDNRFATVASVASLTLQDVQVYFAQAFRPEHTTIVVMGDIQPRHARLSIERAFGLWRYASSTPRLFSVAPPANVPAIERVVDTHLTQATVTLAETIPVTRKSLDYASLVVGDTVLSGASYASTLSKDLRESRGLVYSIYTALNVTNHRGEYRIQYGCNPREVDTVKKIIVRDLEAMADGEITADDLFRAQSVLLRGHLLAQANSAALAAQVISESENSNPHEALNAEQERLLLVTPRQIKAAFERAIRPNALIEIILGPADGPTAKANATIVPALLK